MIVSSKKQQKIEVFSAKRNQFGNQSFDEFSTSTKTLQLQCQHSSRLEVHSMVELC
jgi:hypothetical protein